MKTTATRATCPICHQRHRVRTFDGQELRLITCKPPEKKRRTKRVKAIKHTDWHRIDAGHYARRLPDGRDLVVRAVAPKRWAFTGGGECESMTAAINECERIAGLSG